MIHAYAVQVIKPHFTAYDTATFLVSRFQISQEFTQNERYPLLIQKFDQ